MLVVIEKLCLILEMKPLLKSHKMAEREQVVVAESKADQSYPLNVVYCGGMLTVCNSLVVYEEW